MNVQRDQSHSTGESQECDYSLAKKYLEACVLLLLQRTGELEMQIHFWCMRTRVFLFNINIIERIA